MTTAFLITATIATPLYGKLSDIYGRKPLLAVVLSLCIKEVPLRRVSGMEAVRMEAEAAHVADPSGATH